MPEGLLFRGKYVGQSKKFDMTKIIYDDKSTKSYGQIPKKQRPVTAQNRNNRQMIS